MLPKKKRLARAVFSKIAQGGARHFPLYTIRVTWMSPGEMGKFSVVVSKKVAPKAARRNELRRLVYTVVRAANPVGYSAIIYLKKGFAVAPKRSARAELMKDVSAIQTN